MRVPLWVNRTVVGIILATFLSDASHEMCTAVLPLYLTTLHLGPAALGLIEGCADFLVSLSKLAGGIVGHHVERKRPLAALGYLTTTLATGAIGLVAGLWALVSLRGVAWMGRGFRGPLRDYLLADAVEPSHYGRAYGLERAGDMFGAVVGPLIAASLIWGGVNLHTVILWTLGPGLLAAASLFFLARDRPAPVSPIASRPLGEALRSFPSAYWLFVFGVFLFGLGDFSRTFLVLIGAQYLGEAGVSGTATFSLAAFIYMFHNLISALVAYPIGARGDHGEKFTLLLWGYGLGVGTNLLLAVATGSLPGLIIVVILSGSYIAVEETLEKAVTAEMLSPELRSLGFGLLACANASGDLISSLYVGYFLEGQNPALAFGVAALFGAMGVLWLFRFRQWVRRNPPPVITSGMVT